MEVCVIKDIAKKCPVSKTGWTSILEIGFKQGPAVKANLPRGFPTADVYN